MKTCQSILLLSVLTMISTLIACGGSNKPAAPQVVSIAALSGSGQKMSVGGTFAAPLLAWVTTGVAPAADVTVTFTAPTSGAGGTFAGGATTATAATDNRGIAASPVFTANSTTGTYAVMASVSGASPPASFNLTNIAAQISVTLNPAPPTSMPAGATTMLTAVVANDSTNSGVTWSCTPLNACGSFNPATSTGSTAITTYTAPAAVPSGGTLTITASAVQNSSASASAIVTITVPLPISVLLNPPPPTVMRPGATTTLTAVVANDPTNSGVTWSCTPLPLSACGSFSPLTSTGSTATTTYTAPAAIPSGGSVTITATAVQSASASASAVITITNTISVSFNPAPPISLKPGFTTTLTAVVVNDSTNSGVTWSCTPLPLNACGSFNPATSTGSTAITTYTAPATIPSGGLVTVTATAVQSASASASANIAITTAVLADGIYSFRLAGENLVAGAFQVKNGAITGGEQDLIGLGFSPPGMFSDLINSTGSSISTTANGNLQIILTTCSGKTCTSTDANVGVNGVETLDGTLVSASRALITEFDTAVTSSGSLDRQVSPVTAPTHGYAFFTSGFNSSFLLVGIGGIINVDGTASHGTIPISGTGSVFDINNGDPTLGHVISENQSFSPSSVTTPDAFGRVTFALNPSAASGISPINLVGYIVDPGHIHLVETSDSFGGFTSGEALGQGISTGNFSSASLSGSSYVFGATGGNSLFGFQMAGMLTANSNGTVSGTLNCNDTQATCTQSPMTFTGGAYTLDATGRATLTNLVTLPAVSASPVALQLYLSGSGTGIVVSMDTTDMVSGLAYQQTAGASFSGTYGINASGVDFNQFEFDDVGPVSVGSGSLTATNSIDQNYAALGTPPTTPTPGLSASGTFTPFVGGVLTGTITGLAVPGQTTTPSFTYYIVDATRVLAIETDTNQLTLIHFELIQ